MRKLTLRGNALVTRLGVKSKQKLRKTFQESVPFGLTSSTLAAIKRIAACYGDRMKLFVLLRSVTSLRTRMSLPEWRQTKTLKRTVLLHSVLIQIMSSKSLLSASRLMKTLGRLNSAPVRSPATMFSFSASVVSFFVDLKKRICCQKYAKIFSALPAKSLQIPVVAHRSKVDVFQKSPVLRSPHCDTCRIDRIVDVIWNA